MYRLDYQVYRRPFRQPLRTAHGDWREREGLWVRLTDGDRQGWGEVAPLPWFGSESLGEAIAFLQAHSYFPGEDCPQAPDNLPACQFALRSAWWDLEGKGPPIARTAHNPTDALLLPSGIAALGMVQRYNGSRLPEAGGRTWKWKIGVATPWEEMAIFSRLAAIWWPGDRLRLDANGGLTELTAQRWLRLVAGSPMVEFLEQPLPPGEELALWRLAERFDTPIALDESVSRIGDLARWCRRGWPGVVVLKAGIMGDPLRLQELQRQTPWDGVVSSVLETRIGRRAALGIAPQIHNPQRAYGFGVAHWWIEPEPQPLGYPGPVC